MMTYYAAHAPPSRRSFSVGQLARGHFGHGHNYIGDGLSFPDEACGGRTTEEYLACYPMKKCRSHTSISQTADLPFDTEDCGYVVTSAPENAICMFDTDDELECCVKGSADAGCGCASALPVRLQHSATSSTVMSSLSGACSPPQPDYGASKTDIASATDTQLAADRHHHHHRKLPAGRPASASVPREGSDSDLMGAFGILTPDQWSALRSAVSVDGQPPAEALVAAAPQSELPSAHQPLQHDTSTLAIARTALPPLPEACVLGASPTQAQAQWPGPGAPSNGSSDGDGDAVAQPDCGFTGGASGRQPAGAAAEARSTEGWGEDGGSASSIASLWAAVNSTAASGVCHSTDDNVQAVGPLPPSLTAIRAPVVAAVVPRPHGEPAQPPAACDTAMQPGVRPCVGFTDSNVTHQRQHHTGKPPAPADARASADQTVLSGSPPGDMAPRAASCLAGSHLAAHARHHVLQYGLFSHEPVHSSEPLARVAELPRAHSRNSFDVGYIEMPSRHAELTQKPLQQQPQQQPQPQPRLQVTFQEHHEVHQHHQHHYHPPQQHPQQQQQQLQQQEPDSPDDHHQDTHQQRRLQPPQPQPQTQQPLEAPCPTRRRTSTLALPPSQGAAYTTYGYRRAHSSVASLEQTYPHVHGAASSHHGGQYSSSDDDTEEATRRITAAFRTHTSCTRSSGWGLLGPDTAPATPTCEAGGRKDAWASVAAGSGSSNLLGAAVSGECGDGSGHSKDSPADGDGEDGSCPLTRKRSSYHLTNSHAAVELFLRLNHARQTMDFVKRQTLLFASLEKAELGIWEALSLLDELREYEAVLMAEGGEAQELAALSLRDHAFQTAELCRLHHPDLDWLHLVGLIHGLGKLLAHRRFGSQPQWAICGETYPLGCRFSPHILGSQYFTANPDRRRRLYNTPTGLYGPGCGLLNVVMSWSAPEYLYLALMLNSAPLPQDAVWVLRHAKFLTLTRPHSCYLPLCSPDDLRRLPLLRSFQQLAAFRRVELPEGFALQGQERTAYYSGLIAKYIGEGKLRW